jgi:hypothetical protein
MGPAVGILLGGSMLALLYNIVLFLTIKTLSGVTMNVMGNIKIIFLLLMSRVVLGELAGERFGQQVFKIKICGSVNYCMVCYFIFLVPNAPI